MAIRFGGRLLKGNDVRIIVSDLRQAGLAREMYRAVQRGDTLSNFNKILEPTGIKLNKGQLGQLITERYGVKTSQAYFNKLQATHGLRSSINMDNLRAIGWTGKTRVILEGVDSAGNKIFRTKIIDNTGQKSLSDFLDEIIQDYKDFTCKDTDLAEVTGVVQIRHY